MRKGTALFITFACHGHYAAGKPKPSVGRVVEKKYCHRSDIFIHSHLTHSCPSAVNMFVLRRLLHPLWAATHRSPDEWTKLCFVYSQICAFLDPLKFLSPTSRLQQGHPAPTHAQSPAHTTVHFEANTKFSFPSWKVCEVEWQTRHYFQNPLVFLSQATTSACFHACVACGITKSPLIVPSLCSKGGSSSRTGTVERCPTIQLWTVEPAAEGKFLSLT